MGLLENLWDETLAGPQPDSGLGRLHRHNIFNFRSSSGKEDDGGNGRSNGQKTIIVENAEEMKVTRSITIVKSPRTTGDSNSPSSPFSGNKSGFSRRSSSHSDEKSKNNSGAMPSPSSQDV